MLFKVQYRLIVSIYSWPLLLLPIHVRLVALHGFNMLFKFLFFFLLILNKKRPLKKKKQCIVNTNKWYKLIIVQSSIIFSTRKITQIYRFFSRLFKLSSTGVKFGISHKLERSDTNRFFLVTRMSVGW